MGILKKALYQAHDLVRQVVKPGDAVIDATMGNGNDTLFLAGLVGTMAGFSPLISSRRLWIKHRKSWSGRA